MKILVYGYGNPGRQDDGLGIRLCGEVEEWAAESGLPDITCDTNYQLNAEDALAVSEHDAVIFADAVKTGEKPFDFQPLQPAARIAFSTHAMNPETVLALCEELYGKRPRGYILSITGTAWEPAESLTAEAEENLILALAFIKERLLHGEF